MTCSAAAASALHDGVLQSHTLHKCWAVIQLLLMLPATGVTAPDAVLLQSPGDVTIRACAFSTDTGLGTFATLPLAQDVSG
jgi:hypothetical protein